MTGRIISIDKGMSPIYVEQRDSIVPSNTECG